jgi:hypothetical protein
MTLPAAMAATVSRFTNSGARAPATNTAPISRSAPRASSSMFCEFDMTVWMRLP